MNRFRLPVAAAILALTAISFFWFPGHTLLESDSQIYIPILEHLWNNNVLANDPMAAHPHVTFTLYDEVAWVLRWVTRARLEPLLLAQQFAYRAVGIAALFLLAEALGLSTMASLLVAGIVSLGATVNGPMVLTVEYEPVPRAFAMPFLLLSLALLARRNWMGAAVAAAVAFLFHPPTAVAYCVLLAAAAVWTGNTRALLPISGAALFFVAIVTIPHRSPEGQEVFAQIDPQLEHMQRLRANYNWVSVWWKQWLGHYLLLSACAAAAMWRCRAILNRTLQWIIIGLLAAGLFSFPVSWFFLEQQKWILMPQFQPGRYLVFVTLFAMLLPAIAAARAAVERRRLEAALFLLLAFAVPMHPRLTATLLPSNSAGAVRLGLAIALAAAAGVLAAAFIGLPLVADAPRAVSTDNPELDATARWAHENTKPVAVFFFPQAGRSVEPGIFRARALRTIYVDWKSGGQVNFIRAFATVWWDRWNAVKRARKADDFRRLGIDYLVLPANAPTLGGSVVYSNSRYKVVATGALAAPLRQAGLPLRARGWTPARPAASPI